MTCIAAATDGRTVWMAADSGSEAGDRVFARAASKIMRLPVGDSYALVGSAGRSLVGPLFAKVKLDQAPDATDDADCDAWAQAVAEAWTELAMNLEPKPVDQVGTLDGVALLGYAGRIWYVTENEAERCRDSFNACGSGAGVALGAFHVLEHTRRRLDLAGPIRDDAQTAVEAACRFSQGCYAPSTTDQTGSPAA